LNGENGKRDFKKMRVSQNYARGSRLRSFTSTPFEGLTKIGVFARFLPANS